MTQTRRKFHASSRKQFSLPNFSEHNALARWEKKCHIGLLCKEICRSVKIMTTHGKKKSAVQATRRRRKTSSPWILTNAGTAHVIEHSYPNDCAGALSCFPRHFTMFVHAFQSQFLSYQHRQRVNYVEENDFCRNNAWLSDWRSKSRCRWRPAQ